MSPATTVNVAAPQLEFDVEGVEPLEYAAVPTLAFRVRVDAGKAAVRSLALNVQLRIESQRRPYDADERGRLFELFGPSGNWSRTLRSLRWTTASLTVPAFEGATTVEVPVPCTYDFDVVASKYLDALGGGSVPLTLLFSGTVFFTAAGGNLQVVHLPWDREAQCALPVQVWREALEQAFPGTAWVRVRRDLFERLQAYKNERALLTWDATLEELLPDD